jgi:hypothetical protein
MPFAAPIDSMATASGVSLFVVAVRPRYTIAWSFSRLLPRNIIWGELAILCP